MESTGSATDWEDLMTKMLAFATGAPGWTQDQAVGTSNSGRECALHKGRVFVQFRWANPMGVTAAMYQSTGYTGGNRAGTHPNDSGNGYNTNTTTTSSILQAERCMDTIGNGPFSSYYFYSDAGGTYIHVAVEISTGTFEHFGFGTITKFGDWNTATGGEYCYGHPVFSANSAVSTSNSWLMDGGGSLITTAGDLRLRWPTIRLKGFPNQAGATEWATVCGNRTATIPADTAGNARSKVMGGYRAGLVATGLGGFPAGNTSGLAPMTPIGLQYIDEVSSPSRVYHLGFIPDQRMVDMQYLAAKDTFVVGGDTWRVFPIERRVEGVTSGDTDFLGVAYKT